MIKKVEIKNRKGLKMSIRLNTEENNNNLVFLEHGNMVYLQEKNTAYVEILEILQELDANKTLSLDFDIEDRYPII